MGRGEIAPRWSTEAARSSPHLTPEQRERADRILEDLKARGDEAPSDLADLPATREDHELLGHNEFEVRDLVHKLGARAVEAAATRRKLRGYRGSSLSCPRCREAARFVGHRGRTIRGLLGPMRLERADYHGKACRAGTGPGDEALGLDAAALSPAAREVARLAGAVEAFGPAAATLLHRMAGLRLSESTVRRAAEAAGAAVGRRLADGESFGEAADWGRHKDAEGKSCAYVSIGATGTRQQAPGGGKADGRMMAVAMVYNPVPEDRSRWARPAARHRPGWRARYVASLDGQAALGGPLRRQAAQGGMDRAERRIAISEGGAGLEVPRRGAA